MRLSDEKLRRLYEQLVESGAAMCDILEVARHLIKFAWVELNYSEPLLSEHLVRTMGKMTAELFVELYPKELMIPLDIVITKPDEENLH